MKLKNTIFLIQTIKDWDATLEVWFIPSIKRLLDKDLPIKNSYALRKLFAQIVTKEKVYNEARMPIFQKYWEEKNDVLTIPTEKLQEANVLLNEIIQIEEEYEFEKIKLPEDIKISAMDIIQLEEILKE
jgi:hypothetical protein